MFILFKYLLLFSSVGMSKRGLLIVNVVHLEARREYGTPAELELHVEGTEFLYYMISNKNC